MGLRPNVSFQFNFEHIRMFCLLVAVFKVTGTFSQAFFCAGGPKSLDICLNETGILRKNTTDMPTSIEELNAVCSDFRKGMKCIRDFAFACLEQNKRESFEQHFEPATYIMRQLCENHELRQEYLKYPDCHKKMSPEWERCSEPFISLVHGQNANAKDHSEDKIVKICCAKLCFLGCINRVSQLKCEAEAAAIHRGLAASLNGSPGNKFNCTSLVNSTICKDTCSGSSRNVPTTAQLIVFVLTYILFYSWKK